MCERVFSKRRCRLFRNIFTYYKIRFYKIISSDCKSINYYSIVQFDVKTAFLYGELQEEIFITPLEGVKCKPNMVCLLKKSLYGLKQSPKCWNRKFDKFIKLFGLLPSGEDPCFYVGNIKGSKVYLILFVDDGFIAAPNEEYCSIIVKQLRNNFKITVSKIEYFRDGD